jgi:hypothetical protein
MWAKARVAKEIVELLKGAEQRMVETAKIVEREHVKSGQKPTPTK